ncbi:hypothetical protein OY671_008470, partial [Metschnikowia pulcherrima]
VSYALYAGQAEGKEAGGFGQGALPSGSSWAWEKPGSASEGAKSDVIQAPGPVHRLALTWYRTGDSLTGSNARLKSANIADRSSLRRRPTATLIVSSEGSDGQTEAAVRAFSGATGMCGIAGIFHTEGMKPVDPARSERMCDAIAHRGPDGQGIWTAPGVASGHRRSAIIDSAGSPQPMAATDGSAMLVFNGEIYNFRELCRELQADGAQFHTDGDSEVISAAWQRWGVDCSPRSHGMFSFALYDSRQRTSSSARDR